MNFQLSKYVRGDKLCLSKSENTCGKVSQYIHLTSALRSLVCLPFKKRYVHIKMCDSFLLKFNFLLIC